MIEVCFPTFIQGDESGYLGPLADIGMENFALFKGTERLKFPVSALHALAERRIIHIFSCIIQSVSRLFIDIFFRYIEVVGRAAIP